MLNFSEAEKIISQEIRKLPQEFEEVELLDSLNHFLADDVYSDINLPPFDNSAMDGYAVKYSENISRWKIIGEISAGNFSEIKLDDPFAVSIMTGAKLPEGADTVVPIEDVELEGDFVKLKENAKYKYGINIRKKGEDLKIDSIAIEKNTLIRPRHISVAASCGQKKIKIYKKLKIGVLATGDELISIHEKPSLDKIRCSNLYTILAAVKELNQQPVNFGIVKDDKELLRERLKWAVEDDLDILITTGGVSVGKYDFVKELLEELKVDIKFWKVNIKPGKPLLFGVHSKAGKITLIFGLPGNPVSCLVSFKIFIQENILKLYNRKNEFISAVLEEEIIKIDKKRHYIRGILIKDENGISRVRKFASQSSGNLAQMGKSNCLIIVEEEKEVIKKGEIAKCIMM